MSRQTQTCDYNGPNHDRPLKWAMGGKKYSEGWERIFGNAKPVDTYAEGVRKCGCCHQPMEDDEIVDYHRDSEGNQLCRHQITTVNGLCVQFRKGREV